MSGFSFGSLFGLNSAPAAPAAAPVQGNPNAPGNPGAPGAPVTPANGNTPTTGAPAEGGGITGPAATTQPGALDLFQQLMQNNGAGPTEGQAPSFTIPQETLQAASAKLDFLQGAPQEAMQRLQQGDLSALPEILNHVGRAGYQTAMTHSMALTNQFVGDRIQHEQAGIDKRIGQRLATSNLPSITELHPVAQGMFKETVTKLSQSYPQATQAQLEQQAWVMMEDLGKQFDRAGRNTQQQQQAAEPNWDRYGGFAEDVKK